MPRTTWHITKDAESLTLSRRLPARFDVWGETELPRGNRLRIAHQIRQDLWRALQDLRGFAPVVQLTAQGAYLRVRAGGQIDGRFSRASVEAQIAAVLEDGSNRARWSRFAAPKPAVTAEAADV
ncbi:hypothetical protein N6L24_09910 [Cognatishimia sp. SS12]|uniref:hypothetical protein n=1 Tax=Cognatishimia sp. SS12 TaxID=2979465 RepID=UPI00232FAE96|nr:hypothetical protein [Cognatishimia sp. SS12]MDC0738596.1 hypothetical protein [Cognatishimia sp. SS12]